MDTYSLIFSDNTSSRFGCSWNRALFHLREKYGVGVVIADPDAYARWRVFRSEEEYENRRAVKAVAYITEELD